MAISALSDIGHTKSFVMSDNDKQQILCKVVSIDSSSDFRTTSEFVYKTVPLGITRGGACVVRTHLARKPLRLIIARFPVIFEVAPDYLLTYYQDTLSCGHQVITYSHEQAKKRRGCEHCLAASLFASEPQMRIKFSSESTSPKRKRDAA